MDPDLRAPLLELFIARHPYLAGFAASPTCAILTTEPNDLARQVHDRMPVILPPDRYAPWIDPKPGDAVALRPLLAPFPAAEMTARPVSTAVNNARFDDPACVAPAPEKPRQDALF